MAWTPTATPPSPLDLHRLRRLTPAGEYRVCMTRLSDLADYPAVDLEVAACADLSAWGSSGPTAPCTDRRSGRWSQGHQPDMYKLTTAPERRLVRRFVLVAFAFPAAGRGSCTVARPSRRSSFLCWPSTRSARATPGSSTSRCGQSPTRSPRDRHGLPGYWVVRRRAAELAGLVAGGLAEGGFRGDRH